MGRRNALKVEFTMPEALHAKPGDDVSMTDQMGRSWPSVETQWSGNDDYQRISAKFEVAEGSRFGVVHVGDLDVDMASRRVTRRAKAK